MLWLSDEPQGVCFTSWVSLATYRAVRGVYLLGEFSDVESGEGRLFGTLHYSRVATSQDRCDLPGEHEEGEVPWDNTPYHSNRLVSRVHKRATIWDMTVVSEVDR